MLQEETCFTSCRKWFRRWARPSRNEAKCVFCPGIEGTSKLDKTEIQANASFKILFSQEFWCLSSIRIIVNWGCRRSHRIQGRKEKVVHYWSWIKEQANLEYVYKHFLYGVLLHIPPSYRIWLRDTRLAANFWSIPRSYHGSWHCYRVHNDARNYSGQTNKCERHFLCLHKVNLYFRCACMCTCASYWRTIWNVLLFQNLQVFAATKDIRINWRVSC